MGGRGGRKEGGGVGRRKGGNKKREIKETD